MDDKKINVELLEKVKRHILEEPKRYDQGVYGSPSKSAPCGTQACLAGWTYLLTGGSKRDLYEFSKEVSDLGRVIDAPDVWEIARYELGLTEDEAGVLFSAGEWPEEFQEKYNDARNKRGKAQAAADYLDFIIRTGKVTD